MYTKNSDIDFIVTCLGLGVSLMITILVVYGYGYNSESVGSGFETFMRSENKYTFLEEFFYQTFPGMLFSLYVSIFFLKEKTTLIRLLLTLVLYIAYVASYYLGFFTFGIFNISSGGVGAMLIMRITNIKVNLIKALLVGMLMGVIGFFSVLIFSDAFDTNKNGEVILLSCMPWQIIIGGWLLSTKLVKQKKL